MFELLGRVEIAKLQFNQIRAAKPFGKLGPLLLEVFQQSLFRFFGFAAT